MSGLFNQHILQTCSGEEGVSSPGQLLEPSRAPDQHHDPACLSCQGVSGGPSRWLLRSGQKPEVVTSCNFFLTQSNFELTGQLQEPCKERPDSPTVHGSPAPALSPSLSPLRQVVLDQTAAGTQPLFSAKYFHVYFSGPRHSLRNQGTVVKGGTLHTDTTPAPSPLPAPLLLAGVPPRIPSPTLWSHVSLLLLPEPIFHLSLHVLTLTFLKRSGRLLCRVSFNLGLSAVPSRLDSGMCLWREDG